MFVSDTTRVHLLNPSWVCSGPLLTSSCLPMDGGEGAEVSCGFIPPTAAWEGAQHSHCGGLCTLCSIIMASTSVSISHHSSFRLRNLYALPLLKQRNQFFGQPVSFKYPVEAAQSFLFTPCCSQILSWVSPELLFWPSLESPSPIASSFD